MPVRPNLVRLLLAVAARLAAMLSYPCGAALAKQLFPAVSAQGTTAFRLGLAAPILLAGRRPWRRRTTAEAAAPCGATASPSGR